MGSTFPDLSRSNLIIIDMDDEFRLKIRNNASNNFLHDEGAWQLILILATLKQWKKAEQKY